nr:uncharacterized protein LOC129050040 [Pongo abelii]
MPSWGAPKEELRSEGNAKRRRWRVSSSGACSLQITPASKEVTAPMYFPLPYYGLAPQASSGASEAQRREAGASRIQFKGCARKWEPSGGRCPAPERLPFSPGVRGAGKRLEYRSERPRVRGQSASACGVCLVSTAGSLDPAATAARRTPAVGLPTVRFSAVAEHSGSALASLHLTSEMGKCTHHGFSGCSNPRTPMSAPRRPQTQRGASSTRDPLKATRRAVSGGLAGPDAPALRRPGLRALAKRARLPGAAATSTRRVFGGLRETQSSEVTVSAASAGRTPRWFFTIHPREQRSRACAHGGLPRVELSGSCGWFAALFPPTPLTPLPGASALTCQCDGSSGPALSTRGAECGRGQSRRGSARGQRDRE